MYASDGKAARDKRAKQRELRQTALNKLGDREYKKLLQEVDLMTHTSVDINKLIDKRVNEIQERMEAERKEEEAAQRRVTRSQAGTSAETTAETEPVPQVRSPRKRGKEDDHKETGGKKPKTTEPKDTAEKTPKTSERKETGGKKPKTPKAPQHIDDEDYELDLNTGKFIQKKTSKDDANDESTGRKRKSTAIPLLEDDRRR